VLLTSTKPGDTVLDPFLGSGTTGAVSKRLGRKFIGIERDTKYLQVARERIAAVVPYDESVNKRAVPKREAKRVPFRAVIEAGLLKPGTVLYDAKRKHKAVVRPDGTLEIGGKCVSIHKAGAIAMKAKACNGWGYWYFEEKGELASIDEIRESIRWD